jgi:hypothetical protein
MFYNVENLYDPYNDTTILDDEFTAEGKKHWTYRKFREKITRVARTVIAAGGWDTVAFAGFCEVENRYVLNKLIYDSPLRSYGFRIIHHDSPDARGVDVAALYQPQKMRLLGFRYFSILFPFDTAARTRDILYVKAVLFETDTIHLFVNHWPSRRGGQGASSPRRNFVAARLRALMDSVQGASPGCVLVAFGDLNDEPGDESIRKYLGAGTDPGDTGRYLNLMGMKHLKWTEGTIRYRSRWSVFDQYIVSRNMLDGNSSLVTSPALAVICRFPFLLEDDPSFFGMKLDRTYVGPRYHGGFSDHLPVLLEIRKRGH